MSNFQLRTAEAHWNRTSVAAHNGGNPLSRALGVFRHGVRESSDGVTAFSDGVSAFSDGVSAFSDGVPAFSDGVPAFSDGVAERISSGPESRFWLPSSRKGVTLRSIFMLAVSATAVSCPAQQARSIKVTVEGEGYLRFVQEGRIVYSRSENLVITNGLLASARGPVLTPTVRVSAGADLKFDEDGTITSGGSEIGHIVLALFDSKPVASGPFLVSSFRARLSSPGADGAGRIAIGAGGAPAGQKRTGASALRTAPTPAKQGALPVLKLAIVLAAVTEVPSDQVTVGDLGDVKDEKLAATVLFPAPPIGVNSPVTKYRLQAAFKQAGIDADITVPPNAVIKRKSQVIKRDDFNAAAIAAMNQKLGLELPFNCSDRNGDFTGPAGELELKPETFNTSSNMFSVTLGIYIDGKRVNSRTVSLRPDSTATRIEANTNVKLTMKSAGVSIEVNAKTRTAGFLGQIITVVTDTGTVLEGRIIAADKVEVNV